MLFKNQSKMAAVKIANNIFQTFENSLWAHVLFCTKYLSERYHLVQRHILSQNQVNNFWFVKLLFIMADLKMAAVK